MKSVLIPSFLALAAAGGHMGYVNYTADGVAARGYMAHPTSCTSTAKCPAVAIMPDWNGIDSYEEERAHMLVSLGYFAFVVDIYGVDIVEGWGMEPGMSDWSAASGLHRENATKFMAKMVDGLTQMASHSEVDTTKMAAIGYCFGGTGVLNLAMAGHDSMYSVPAGLLGVASYHAGETGLILEPQTANSHPAISIHTGYSDQNGILPDTMATLATNLEDHGLNYEVSWYGSDVGHGFTVFGGGAYHMIADNRSWSQTELFLEDLFSTVEPDTPDAMSGVTSSSVSYKIGMANYTGYLSWHRDTCSASSPCPGVAIIHDWTGLDDYEQERARLLAEGGMVAFAMDIYGDELIASWGGNPTSTNYSLASNMHRQNASLYMSRIHGGISFMLGLDIMNPDKIAVIGYCFGGTGAINVALAGHGGTYGFPAGVLAAISYHAGESGIIDIDATATSYPKLATHNGYADGWGITPATMKTLQTNMEASMISFEDSYYGSSVMHGFTDWHVDAYHSQADLFSWRQTVFMLAEVFADNMMMSDSTTSTTAAESMDTDTSAASAQAPFAVALVAAAVPMFL